MFVWILVLLLIADVAIWFIDIMLMENKTILVLNISISQETVLAQLILLLLFVIVVKFLAIVFESF